MTRKSLTSYILRCRVACYASTLVDDGLAVRTALQLPPSSFCSSRILQFLHPVGNHTHVPVC